MVITPLMPEDLKSVSSLVCRVFDEHVAPLFPPEGCEEFHRFIEPGALLDKLGDSLGGWVAREEGAPVGVLVLRDGAHVSLFFVETFRQRRGVGRALLGHAAVDAAGRGREALSVNASPNAVGAYVALRFLPTGPAQEKNGITFVPMTRPLDDFRGSPPAGKPGPPAGKPGPPAVKPGSPCMEAEPERLPGPLAVLVCGYEAAERESLRVFLSVVFVEPPGLRPVSAEAPERTVGEVLADPEDPAAPGCGQLPRVLLLAGCTLDEVRGVMEQWQASGLPRPIFAVATENNLGFPVRELVAHLLEEQRAMREARRGPSDLTP